MSADDLPPAPCAPFYRLPPGRPIELIVPRADGGPAQVHQISDDLALIHLGDLAKGLRRRRASAAVTLGRDPA